MLKDLTNQRFGKWTVLNRVGTMNTQATWNCRCDCGKEAVVRGNSLRRGGSLSCGCERPRLYKPEFTGIYNILVKSAEERKIPVSLTFEEFLSFTEKSKCFYCQSPLVWSRRLHGAKHKGHNLDRKDSKKGYSMDNVVPCCYLCNMTKGNRFSHEEFVGIGVSIKKILKKRQFIPE